MAEISQQEEASGQILHQSRHTPQDREGKGWKVIAFKRIYPEGNTLLYLHLEGILGVTNLSRNQPLTFLNCQGKTVEAANKSQEIFPDASPAPHIRQYDLRSILGEVEEELPLCLRLPSAEGSTIELDITSTVIKEWKAIAS